MDRLTTSECETHCTIIAAVLAAVVFSDGYRRGKQDGSYFVYYRSLEKSRGIPFFSGIPEN